MGLAYRGGKDEGWSYDEWLWLGRWVGLGVWDTNSHPPYLHYIHPTQHHSRVNSTPTNPTRLDPRPYQKPSVHYPTNRHTLPPPNQTHSHTSTRPSYPIIPTSYIIVPSKPSPSYPYMPTPPQRLSSVLARRTCH